MKTQWDWDAVFAHLVRMCDDHGGCYDLGPEEVAHMKDRDVGRGWGEYNLRNSVLPRYRPCYPGYDFRVSPRDRVLRCTKRS